MRRVLIMTVTTLLLVGSVDLKAETYPGDQVMSSYRKLVSCVIDLAMTLQQPGFPVAPDLSPAHTKAARTANTILSGMFQQCDDEFKAWDSAVRTSSRKALAFSLTSLVIEDLQDRVWRFYLDSGIYNYDKRAAQCAEDPSLTWCER